MRVLVLGGDGFCGWPSSLHLSAQGHEVVIADNLSRRNIDNELGVRSLTPIQPISKRLAAWQELSGKQLGFERLDIATEYDRLLGLLREFEPDSIVHFAEQRAAPYSMKSAWHKRYTVNNNLNATNNVLCAIVESGMDIHLVHLGTMGVYGYSSAGGKTAGRLSDSENDGRRWRGGGAGDPLSGQPRQHLSHDQRLRTSYCSPSTTRMTTCRSPTCTRASSGARRPGRPGLTSGSSIASTMTVTMEPC